MSRDEGPKTPNARGNPQRSSQIITQDADVARRALSVLAERYGVPAVDMAGVSFPLSNLDLIPVEIARRHKVLPILVREDTICLAMADPNEKRVVEELEFVSGRRVFPYVGDAEHIAQTIDRAYALRDHGDGQFVGPRAAQAVPAPELSEPLGAIHATPAAPAAAVAPIDASAISLDDDDDPGPEDQFGGAPPMSLSAPVGPTLDSVFSPLPAQNGRSILVVDDEEDIRKLLRRVLEDKGYRVLEADRGSVALNMVKQHVPDAIVLDAMLPELHGFDICKRIKASVRYGHIPILMISAVYRGWRFAEDLKTSYGVNAYIEKPFRIAEILAAVETMLAGAPKADGRDPEALTAEADRALATGMLAYKNGDLDGAIELIARAIALDPLAYRLHYHLALLVGRKGDVFRAIQELETAIDLNPKSFAALKNLAVLYQKAGFKHKAIEMWERAIGQSPDNETRGQIKEHLMSLL